MWRCICIKTGISHPHRPQQTCDIGPTMVYCWATVYDAGPTVNQRWPNLSCLCLFVMHCSTDHHQFITSAKGGYVFGRVGSFVCLSAGLLTTDLNATSTRDECLG